MLFLDHREAEERLDSLCEGSEGRGPAAVLPPCKPTGAGRGSAGRAWTLRVVLQGPCRVQAPCPSAGGSRFIGEGVGGGAAGGGWGQL